MHVLSYHYLDLQRFFCKQTSKSFSSTAARTAYRFITVTPPFLLQGQQHQPCFTVRRSLQCVDPCWILPLGLTTMQS